MNPITVTLEKHGDYWRAVWIASDGSRKFRGLGPRQGIKTNTRKPRLSEAAARKKCIEIERELAATPGIRDTGRAPTLADWIDQYLELRHDISHASHRLINNTAEYLKQHFGDDRRIDTITRADAAGFRAALAKVGHSDEDTRRAVGEQTLRKHMRICKTLFGIRHGAQSLDLIAYNPFDRLPSTVAPVDKDWAYIDDKAMQGLLEACPDTSWRALLAIARWAGLRRGEMLALGWADIDFDARRLTVRNEGKQTTKKRTRVVPIDPRLHAVLLERFAGAGDGEAVVALGNNNLIRNLKVIAKRAGITNWVKPFHTLRKNCQSDWNAKYPEPDVCAWLGNSQAVSRAHYHQTLETTMKAAAGEEQSELERLRARIAELEADHQNTTKRPQSGA